ncbi:unnamed protein product [Gongylonema pulchrum]|uniref:Tyrosine-protein phosphatase domain-containing protein n=1 Tax=Gongylonema pulchrum TaxID=637853 RepID=A0A183D7N0_9BILA|nr:unnamed protein product [Gongylonema pulchrum]
MIDRSAKNAVLTEKLLYDVRYDSAWKPSYTKKFSEGKKKPANKAGWVLPLKGLCDKEASKWLENDELNTRNHNLEEFFKKDWDGNGIKLRMIAFVRSVENDRDRVRLQDRYYNNIVMWKALFGSRKQVFIRTMIGGMERRFEILDNQVNHIVFTHHAFDEHLHLCRNKRIKCRDSTRVVLRYPKAASYDFIHANYVQGGPLFNKFIITQVIACFLLPSVAK